MPTFTDNFIDLSGGTPRITLIDTDGTQPDYRWVNGGNNLKLRFGIPNIGPGWQDGTELAAFNKELSTTFTTENFQIKFEEASGGDLSIREGASKTIGEILLTDDKDWTIFHAGTGAADINIESNRHLSLVAGRSTAGSFAVTLGSAGSPEFAITNITGTRIGAFNVSHFSVIGSSQGVSLKTTGSTQNADFKIESSFDLHISAGVGPDVRTPFPGRLWIRSKAGTHVEVGVDDEVDVQFTVSKEDAHVDNQLLVVRGDTDSFRLGQGVDFPYEIRWTEREIEVGRGDWRMYNNAGTLTFEVSSSGGQTFVVGPTLTFNGSELVTEARLDDTGTGVAGSDLVGCPAQTSSGGSASVIAGTLSQQIKALLDLIDP